MNLNSILQVLCSPWEQFLLWVSFWAQFMQHRGLQFRLCWPWCAHPTGRPVAARWGFLLENSQAGLSCAQGTPQHLPSNAGLSYLIILLLTWNRRSVVLWREPRLIQQLTGQHLMQEKGRVTLSLLPGAALLAWQWCDAAFPFVCLWESQ